MYTRRWFRFAFSPMLAVPLIVPAAFAGDGSSPPAIVSRYCSGCHGIDGMSQLPKIPRLAGQKATYLEHKLAKFRSADSAPVDEPFTRMVRSGSADKDDGFTPEATVHMVGIAHSLSKKDLKAAAWWYATQEPAPGKSSKHQVMDEGRSLYLNGVQSRPASACQTCHGAEAQGSETAPRLAGQNAAYVLGQLALFRTDESKRTPMTEVARSLEKNQARALAAYLQSR